MRTVVIGPLLMRWFIGSSRWMHIQMFRRGVTICDKQAYPMSHAAEMGITKTMSIGRLNMSLWPKNKKGHP